MHTMSIVNGYFWLNQSRMTFHVLLMRVPDSAGSANAECTDDTHQLASA